MLELAKNDLRPSKIITRASLENAIASVAASGGSTNAVLHLIAIAHEAGIDLTVDDFDRISRKTPLLADMKPGGRYVATDYQAAGGSRLLAKHMLAGNLAGWQSDECLRTHAGGRSRTRQGVGWPESDSLHSTIR